MTREEVIDYCEMSVLLEPANEDIFNYIIKELEQKPILDKIREDIAEMADADAYGDYQQGCNFGLMLAAQVIDKYSGGK